MLCWNSILWFQIGKFCYENYKSFIIKSKLAIGLAIRLTAKIFILVCFQSGPGFMRKYTFVFMWKYICIWSQISSLLAQIFQCHGVGDHFNFFWGSRIPVAFFLSLFVPWFGIFPDFGGSVLRWVQAKWSAHPTDRFECRYHLLSSMWGPGLEAWLVK